MGLGRVCKDGFVKDGKGFVKDGRVCKAGKAKSKGLLGVSVGQHLGLAGVPLVVCAWCFLAGKDLVWLVCQDNHPAGSTYGAEQGEKGKEKPTKSKFLPDPIRNSLQL